MRCASASTFPGSAPPIALSPLPGLVLRCLVHAQKFLSMQFCIRSGSYVYAWTPLKQYCATHPLTGLLTWVWWNCACRCLQLGWSAMQQIEPWHVRNSCSAKAVVGLWAKRVCPVQAVWVQPCQQVYRSSTWYMLCLAWPLATPIPALSLLSISPTGIYVCNYLKEQLLSMMVPEKLWWVRWSIDLARHVGQSWLFVHPTWKAVAWFELSNTHCQA